MLSEEESAKGEYVNNEGKRVNNEREIEAMVKEIELVDKAREAGVWFTWWVRENEVIAGKGANVGKKVLIDYAYNFIKRNLRHTEKVFDIPHQRLLKVGMT